MALPTFPAARRRNSRYKISDRSLRLSSIVGMSILLMFLGGFGWIWTEMFAKGYVAISGVPSPIITRFLQNETARKAYFDGDSEKTARASTKYEFSRKVKTLLPPSV